MKIGQNHQVVMPYLLLKNAKDFIRFATTVFEAEVLSAHFRDEAQTEVMHAEISIGGSTLMVSEANDMYKATTTNLFIYVHDADVVFVKAMANGAVVVNELADLEYGRSGGVSDSFGNTWWITSLEKI